MKKGGIKHRGQRLVVVSPTPVFGFLAVENVRAFYRDPIGEPELYDLEFWRDHEGGLWRFVRFLFDRIQPKACAIMSGDVHYGFLSQHYIYDSPAWAEDAAEPWKVARGRRKRLVQVTSSPLKNEHDSTWKLAAKGQYVDADEDHLTLYGYHGLDQPLTVAGKEILRQSRREFLLLRHAVDKAARNTPTPIVIREAVLRELGARTDQNPLWAEDVIYERNRHISVSQAPFFHRSHVGLLSLDSRQLCYVVYETASEADLNPDVKSHSYACIGWSLT